MVLGMRLSRLWGGLCPLRVLGVSDTFGVFFADMVGCFDTSVLDFCGYGWVFGLGILRDM